MERDEHRNATAQANWSDRVHLSAGSNSLAGATVLWTGAAQRLWLRNGYARAPSSPFLSTHNSRLATTSCGGGRLEQRQPESSEANNTALFRWPSLFRAPRPRRHEHPFAADRSPRRNGGVTWP